MSTIRVLTGNCLPRFMATPTIKPLHGPPEIYRQNPTTTPSASSAASPSASIIDTKLLTNSNQPSDVITNLIMKTNFHKSPMWPTFRSTGNPCLDFFFHVVPNMSHRKVIQLLEISWAHDPLKTLKLVCNLRGVRGTGKFDKESYYTAALWLHNHHPKTLAFNIDSLAQFGYLKDLPEILFRLLEGSKSRKLAKENCHNKLKALRRKYSCFSPRMKLFQSDPDLGRELDKDDEVIYRKYFEVEKIERVKKVKEKSSANILLLNKDEKKIEMAKKVMERFNTDPNFKILHDRISSLFADCLRSDINLLIGNTNEDCNINISLAAKWCPSLDSSYDKFTLLCEAIAKKVFPREEYEEYVGMEEGHYVYRVRDRLRKQVLVPLRKALELPEVYIGANDLGSLPYNRVASVAMRLYKEKFNKHDGLRFKEYRRKVEEEKAKIKAAGALLPHEIIASLNDEDGGQVAEFKWKRMVDDMLKNGKLSNCIAICDILGYYLEGIPKDVCVALGILLSELSAGLSAEPWKGKLISFSKTPVLYKVEGETLKEKNESIIKVNRRLKARHDNIDFSKVYDLILNEAVNGKLKPDEMIKRIFVFSGTSFDETSTEARKHYAPEPWETSYEAIVSKYRERGYGNSVPEMVFWNLSESKATIVPTKILPGNLPGISLVDGFSKNLMKLFLLEGGDMSPETVMDAAISGEEYKNLVVLD